MPYNPGQIRIPRYHEGGGRWTADRNWQPTTPDADEARVILARGPAPTTTAVRPPPQTTRPADPSQRTTPGSLLPGTPSFPQPATANPPLFPWTPGSPAQLTAPGSPLLWEPSPILDPTAPGRPRSPLQETDLLSHQLDWYAALSAGNKADRRVVLILDRRSYGENSKDPKTALRTLTSEQIGVVCEHLKTVQGLTDAASLHVMNLGNTYTPQQRGTAVHWHVKEGIENIFNVKEGTKIPLSKDLFAEISFMKTLFATGQLPLQRDVNGDPYPPSVPYGRRGSIRIDALESRDAETVCVYDIKTGFSQLSLARMWELADAVFKKFPTVKRILVTEVRPLQGR